MKSKKPKKADDTPTPQKGGKRERTRAALIAAAVQLIAEEGYERLSMDKVAERAGMTKGAIYGNFESKEALLLAVFMTNVRRPPPQMDSNLPAHEQLQQLAGDLVAQAPNTRRMATHLLAFQSYALTHEEMREVASKQNREIYQRMEAWVRHSMPVDELALPPAQFVRLLHVVSNGLLVAHAMSPELYDEQLVRAIFSLFALRKGKKADKK
jgi:AcrR family transcriptional regulator